MKPRQRTSPGATAVTRSPRSQASRWVFRLIAVLMPLLLIAAVEIFLRVADYGFPTKFFLKQKVNGREMLIDNRQFGWRFFPKEIARTPQPVMFPARKEAGTIRIFVFGESAAMGDPEPAFGLPRMLQAMLELRFPGNRFEVINCAMTAINSHVVREIAKECAPLEGDMWLIYMGNNEVVGPFGSGTVFGRQAPPLAFIRTGVWLKQFRIVQWISSLGSKRMGEWQGMEMFLEQQVQRDEPRMKTVRSHFQKNLRDIVERGADSGARVIVGNIAVNLRDCPPFASEHSIKLSSGEKEEWRLKLDRAAVLAKQRQFGEALKILSDLQRRFPTDGHAALYFLLAHCELALGDLDAAHVHFNLAREFDTLRFRADEQVNLAIRNVAAETRATLVDAVKIISARGTNSVPGAESFYEHVHFNFAGNYLLARAFLDEVVRAMSPAVIKAETKGNPSMGDCAKRLAWTHWDRLEVYEEVRKRLQQPPFTGQFNHEQRDRDWQRRIDELGRSLTPQKFQQTVATYQEELRAAPGDWMLRENFAKLLEANDDVPAAIEQWREVARLLPHDLQAQYRLGNLLDTLGRSDEALVYFRSALRRDPASVEARNGMGLALANLGRLVEAEREFETALRLKPKFTEARVNFGQILARQGKAEAAIAQYQTALKLDTNTAAAHVNLGKLLAARGDKAAAVAHYEAALRINPRHAIAHFNLGNALVASNATEAVRHYEEAVRLRPQFAEAHLALALEFAKSGKPAESERHFREAVRLQPNSVDAQFNYGVLLANQKRFPEAARQFTRTLELQPDNTRAREFLQRVSGQ